MAYNRKMVDWFLPTSASHTSPAGKMPTSEAFTYGVDRCPLFFCFSLFGIYIHLCWHDSVVSWLFWRFQLFFCRPIAKCVPATLKSLVSLAVGGVWSYFRGIYLGWWSVALPRCAAAIHAQKSAQLPDYLTIPFAIGSTDSHSYSSTSW